MLSYWFALNFAESDQPSMALVTDYCRTLIEGRRRSDGVLLFFILFAVTALLSWRIWRFTIKPLLWPSEIKDLPYWVPCMRYHDRTPGIKSCTEHLQIIANIN